MGSYDRFIRVSKKLWRDKCTIYGQVKTKNGAFTELSDTKIIENEPCKVIINDLKPSSLDIVTKQSFNAVLLIRNGISIPNGAKIDITDVNGHIRHFKQASGGYTNYVTHQEVGMLYEEKA